MSELTASVVVLTFNRREPLLQCLESLASQTLRQDSFEVVLVDGSDEPVRDLVAQFSDRLRLVHLPGPNLGVAGNRNRGVAGASGSKIVFIDDDCVAWSDWLEEITTALANNPGALIGGKVENAEVENAYTAAGQAIFEAVDAFYNPPGQEARFFPGLNFAVERGRYLAIDGCDGRFGRLAAEDRDFIDRWILAGGKLLACPKAVVQHEHRSNLRGFVRQFFNYGRGAWRYHSLRRRRGSRNMAEDLQLHRKLPRYFREPLQKFPPTVRGKVVVLLVVWEAANLAGFFWQLLCEVFYRSAGENS